MLLAHFSDHLALTDFDSANFIAAFVHATIAVVFCVRIAVYFRDAHAGFNLENDKRCYGIVDAFDVSHGTLYRLSCLTLRISFEFYCQYYCLFSLL